MDFVTPEARKIWDAIERRIGDTPTDGISAQGTFSEIVLAQQQGIIDGLRTARLAAINALSKCEDALP